MLVVCIVVVEREGWGVGGGGWGGGWGGRKGVGSPTGRVILVKSAHTGKHQRARVGWGFNSCVSLPMCTC